MRVRRREKKGPAVRLLAINVQGSNRGGGGGAGEEEEGEERLICDPGRGLPLLIERREKTRANLIEWMEIIYLVYVYTKYIREEYSTVSFVKDGPEFPPPNVLECRVGRR